MEGLKKIISAEQTRLADQHTISNEPIASIDLMERASVAFTRAFERSVPKNNRIIIFCGCGNNGGDGFAIARLLIENGYSVQAVLVEFRNELSPDCHSNLLKLNHVLRLDSISDFPNIQDKSIIIDAILGTGLNSPAKGLVAEVIDRINSSNKCVYSVDIPSGLYCDSLTDSKNIIRANHVISFQRPKLSFFYPENGQYIQNWEVVDIRLDEHFINQQQSDNYLLDGDINHYIKTRSNQSHKGTYGHALLISGSYGKMGAAVLSSKACMRSGAGLLTTYIPKCGYSILQTAVPEAMCITDLSEYHLQHTPQIASYDAIGIGPGIGIEEDTIEMVRTFLEVANQPLVIDADAINIISMHPQFLKLVPKDSILTPHIKEFDRLAGASSNSEERFRKQRALSKEYGIIIVLKDARTRISSATGDCYYNTSGNPGMSTAGSGDVLTGIITSLLAQQYEPLQAALIGVYYHGLAGDSAAFNKGQMGMIASDIIEHLRIN